MKHRGDTLASYGELLRKDGFTDGSLHWDLEDEDVRGRTPVEVGRWARGTVLAATRGGGSEQKPGAWEAALEQASSPLEARRLFRYYLDGLEAGIRSQAARQLAMMAERDAEAAEEAHGHLVAAKILAQREAAAKARHR